MCIRLLWCSTCWGGWIYGKGTGRIHAKRVLIHGKDLSIHELWISLSYMHVIYAGDVIRLFSLKEE